MIPSGQDRFNHRLCMPSHSDALAQPCQEPSGQFDPPETVWAAPVEPIEPVALSKPLGLPDRIYLWIEFLTLFFALPALFLLRTVNIPLLALLGSAVAVSLVLLLRDRTFDRRQLWNLRRGLFDLPRILGVFAFLGISLAAVVWYGDSDAFMKLPRENPRLWLAIMLAYPVLSVFPQTIVYRVFIFHRYRHIFRTREAMIPASALAFTMGHIIFENQLALALTLVGGALFSYSYDKHRSGAMSAIEHAIWGCWIFTIGLGAFLYLAGVAR